MPVDIEQIESLLDHIDAPKGWVFMGHDGPFKMEIRECEHFLEVVTLKDDPNDMANAIAELPTIARTLLEEVKELHGQTSPYLILDDPEGVIGIVDAIDYDDAWRIFQEQDPGSYDGDPEDNYVVIEAVTVEWCDKMVDALTSAHEEIERVKAENVLLKSKISMLENPDAS